MFLAQVRESDPLPKRVCSLCLQQLQLCYHFKESVAEAELQLLAYHRKASSKLKDMDSNHEPYSLRDVHWGAKDQHNIESRLQTSSGLETNTNEPSTITRGGRITGADAKSNILSASLNLFSDPTAEII